MTSLLRQRFIAAPLPLILGLLGCAGPKRPASDLFARQQIVNEIKQVQKTLGFQETSNFSRSSSDRQAYYRCYFTGKLTLPGSYDGLKMRDGTKAGCSIDEEKHDVFFYPVEAVSGGSPITSSLAEAPVERLSVVVAHEDFHDDTSIQALPSRVSEAAATLIGFLTASEFARRKYGVTAREHINLTNDVELFLQKARIVNEYHSQLRTLYQSAASRKAGEAAALAHKRDLFARLQQECEEISPRPASFNPCPAVLNNAGLAFDVTYTKYYPLLYDLFQAQGADLRKTIATLQQQLPEKAGSEALVVGRFRDLIRQARGAGVALGP